MPKANKATAGRNKNKGKAPAKASTRPKRAAATPARLRASPPESPPRNLTPASPAPTPSNDDTAAELATLKLQVAALVSEIRATRPSASKDSSTPQPSTSTQATPAPCTHVQEQDSVSLPSVEEAARAALAGEAEGYVKLGTLLAPSVKKKIWAGEYVALETLHKLDEKNPTFTWDNNKLSISTPKASKPDSIFSWLRLFNTYAAVVCEKEAALGPALFTYQTRILDLQRRYAGFLWRSYDERFRALKAVCTSLPWEMLRWEIVLELAGDVPKKNQNLPRTNQPFRSPGEGTCNSFLSAGTCRFGNKCRYIHKCGLCGQNHSRNLCPTAKPSAAAKPNASAKPSKFQ
jgi:hypothetical protein